MQPLRQIPLMHYVQRIGAMPRRRYVKLILLTELQFQAVYVEMAFDTVPVGYHVFRMFNAVTILIASLKMKFANLVNVGVNLDS